MFDLLTHIQTICVQTKVFANIKRSNEGLVTCIRDVAKLKKFESGWVGPGPFWIENRKLENQEKKIFDDYWLPKKKWIGGCVICSELSIQFFFWMSGIFLPLQGPLNMLDNT